MQEFGPDDRNIAYVREPDGSLAARAYPDEFTGEIYYFDALRSTVVMTDIQGNVTDTYAYDAWGEVEHLSGSTADNPYLYVGELGYYDHWQAPALADMLHLGVRFYEPEVGRFGQRDAAKDGVNWYVYVGSNPARWVDPDGAERRDAEKCYEDRITCWKQVAVWFDECKGSRSIGGPSDAAVCVVGCIPTAGFSTLAYAGCLLGCGLLTGVIQCAEVHYSCGRTASELKDSCEVAYRRCMEKSGRD